jgi:hypothetical protein
VAPSATTADTKQPPVYLTGNDEPLVSNVFLYSEDTTNEQP